MAAWSTFRKMCSVSRYSQAVRLMTLIRLSALSSTLVVSGLLSLGVMLSVVDNDTFESEFSPKICVGTKPGQKGLEIPGPHDVKLGRARVRSNAGGDAIVQHSRGQPRIALQTPLSGCKAAVLGF